MHSPAVSSRFAREDFESLRDALRKISRRDPDEPSPADPGDVLSVDVPAEPEGPANVVDFGLERRKRKKRGQ